MLNYDQFVKTIQERRKDAMKIAGVLNTKVAPGKGFFGFLKAKKIQTYAEFEAWLHDNFYVNQIGEGYFSVGMIGTGQKDLPAELPKQFVLKVSKQNKGNIDSYPRFARLAQMKGRSNPLYPRIKAITVLPRSNTGPGAIDDVHITVLEYLNTHKGNSELGKALADYAVMIEEFILKVQNGEAHNNAEQSTETQTEVTENTFMQSLEYYFNKQMEDLRYAHDQYQFDIKFKHLLDFAKSIEGLGGVDVHHGNIGIRPGTKQLVIFDPISWV